jgi:hypothetical protein
VRVGRVEGDKVAEQLKWGVVSEELAGDGVRSAAGDDGLTPQFRRLLDAGRVGLQLRPGTEGRDGDALETFAFAGRGVVHDPAGPGGQVEGAEAGHRDRTSGGDRVADLVQDSPEGFRRVTAVAAIVAGDRLNRSA